MAGPTCRAASMIRFMADTWLDWLLRPLAMAAPDGWIYTEVSAPDFRFVAALLLGAVLIAAWRFHFSKIPQGRQLAALSALIFVSFNIWMWTSGNGRYFIPYLVLIGPICIALVAALPSTTGLKAVAVLVILVAQGFALSLNSPWRPFGSLEWVEWSQPPYFDLDGGTQTGEKDTTYVSLANLSFSLVAPMFDESSRWLNLAIFSGADTSGPTAAFEPARKMLASAKHLRLFHRAQVSEMREDNLQPTPRAVGALNRELAPYQLALQEPVDCKVLRSAGLQQLTFTHDGMSSGQKAHVLSRASFWICPLSYPASRLPNPADREHDDRARQLFEKIERLCPRFFRPGQSLVSANEAGAYTRAYAASDSNLTVGNDGSVYMKYGRALNPQRIGSWQEILDPAFKLDCGKFRGRAGLPWEREI